MTWEEQGSRLQAVIALALSLLHILHLSLLMSMKGNLSRLFDAAVRIKPGVFAGAAWVLEGFKEKWS